MTARFQIDMLIALCLMGALGIMTILYLNQEKIVSDYRSEMNVLRGEMKRGMNNVIKTISNQPNVCPNM